MIEPNLAITPSTAEASVGRTGSENPRPQVGSYREGRNGLLVEYLEPQAVHIAELARICFEAFGQLHDLHHVPRDFSERVVAEKVIGFFVLRPEFHGVAALVDGRLAGSNFLSAMDEVGGIGPITVAPGCQGSGVGRGLMERILDRAAALKLREVRLVQEAINTTSLSLYASLGFSTREPLGLMTIQPAPKPDPAIRLATADDLPQLADLSKRFYGVDRSRELALWIAVDCKVLIREKRDKAVGYFMPGKFGHGAAHVVEDMLALIGEAGRLVPADIATFLCPLRNTHLHQKALRAGHRLLKVLNYMTRGPFEPARGVWAPSYGY